MKRDTVIYPRQDRETIYLRNAITDPAIEVGAYTLYNDFVHDPRDFQKNNVLYHFEGNQERLIIGRFCSIACGAKFMFNGANHEMDSLATYPFPQFYEAWEIEQDSAENTWDNKGDICIGNDVWIGYDAIIMAGVTVGNGAIIGTRAIVTKDVPPYAIVAGAPARVIRSRFPQETIDRLLALRWWDWPPEKIREKIADIRNGNLDALCE